MGRSGLRAVAALALLAVVGLGGAPGAWAASGAQRYVIVGDGAIAGGVKVVATGVFDGVGTDVVVSFTQHADGTFDGVDTFAFAAGDLEVSFHGLTDDLRIDRRTCTGLVTAHGTLRVTGGTGALAGATGESTFTLREVLRFDRTTEGCSEAPAHIYGLGQVDGSLTLP